MSTRCTINFRNSKDGANVAKIYRHMDGYPDGAHGVPADLNTFFEDVIEQTNDTRFNDASYLAAKFVVWQAEKNTRGNSPLNFLSLGITNVNAGDIEWEYFVICDLPHFSEEDSKTKPDVFYSPPTIVTENWTASEYNE